MGSQQLRKKPDYCWSFNKGEPCRFGSKCRFIERCSYCDSPSHPIIHCSKVKKKGAIKKTGSGPPKGHGHGQGQGGPPSVNGGNSA